MEWFQIGKGVCQGCILSPCSFNKYIIRNAGLGKAQAAIKLQLQGEISITSDMQIKSLYSLSLLMKVKGEWKSCLETQHSNN